jgi:hypothetical protein
MKEFANFVYIFSHSMFAIVFVQMFQTSASTSLASVARLRVYIGDVNNKVPVFQGTDENGVYPAAVSSLTVLGETIIYVTAIDLDRDPPNNVVGH